MYVFECGKTQILSILLHQAAIMVQYEANGPEDRRRHCTTNFVEVNDAVYKWYCLARHRNMCLDHFYKKKLCRLLKVSMQIPYLKHQMAGLIVSKSVLVSSK